MSNARLAFHVAIEYIYFMLSKQRNEQTIVVLFLYGLQLKNIHLEPKEPRPTECMPFWQPGGMKTNICLNLAC